MTPALCFILLCTSFALTQFKLYCLEGQICCSELYLSPVFNLPTLRLWKMADPNVIVRYKIVCFKYTMPGRIEQARIMKAPGASTSRPRGEDLQLASYSHPLHLLMAADRPLCRWAVTTPCRAFLTAPTPVLLLGRQFTSRRPMKLDHSLSVNELQAIPATVSFECPGINKIGTPHSC